MTFDIKSKDDKNIEASVDFPEDKTKTDYEEDERMKNIIETAIKSSESFDNNDNNEIIENNSNEDNLPELYKRANRVDENIIKNYKDVYGEDFPTDQEEIISKNLFLTDKARNILRTEGYKYNKTQIRRNFSILFFIILSIIEIVEIFFLESPNKTYITIVPILMVICLIYFIIFSIKKKKYDKKIVEIYNSVYRDLCLIWSKFGLKFEKSELDNTFFAKSTENSPISIKLKTNEDNDNKFTDIIFDECKLIKFDSFDLIDKNAEKYTCVPIYENNEIKGIRINNYCYNESFNSFFDNYNYKKITEMIICDNIILDSIFDFVSSEYLN